MGARGLLRQFKEQTNRYYIMTAQKKLLRLKHVLAKVPFSKSHLHVLIRENKFPKPTKIGRNSFWLESLVDKYIDEQVNQGMT